MSMYESLSHAKWDCKYHIVFVPKGRKKERYGQVRKFLGEKRSGCPAACGGSFGRGH